MARWKIINSDKAEEIGIKEVSPDNDGFISINVAKFPKGLSMENVIDFAEKMGIIMRFEP
jgi:hypothetical protein